MEETPFICSTTSEAVDTATATTLTFPWCLMLYIILYIVIMVTEVRERAHTQMKLLVVLGQNNVLHEELK